MTILILDLKKKKTRLLRPDRVTTSCSAKEEKGQNWMDPRAFFSWVFFALSEQGPNLGASTYLANCLEMVELEGGWAQVPVTSRS